MIACNFQGMFVLFKEAKMAVYESIFLIYKTGRWVFQEKNKRKPNTPGMRYLTVYGKTRGENIKHWEGEKWMWSEYTWPAWNVLWCLLMYNNKQSLKCKTITWRKNDWVKREVENSGWMQLMRSSKKEEWEVYRPKCNIWNGESKDGLLK